MTSWCPNNFRKAWSRFSSNKTFTSLSALSVGKLDQTFDLIEGQGREAFAEFLESFPQVIAVHDGIRQNARPSHNGPSRHLAGDPFDELALHPINIGVGVHCRRLFRFLPIAAPIYDYGAPWGRCR